MNHTKTDPTSIDGDEGHYADPAGRSSSEEKDNMAPAQSKRKAQNRAAYVMSRHLLLRSMASTEESDIRPRNCKTDMHSTY